MQNKKNILFVTFIFFVSTMISFAQEKYVPIYFPEYGRFITIPEDYKLNDTISISHSPTTYIKLVLFNKQGKSYCEVYKKNRLYEKGYYENAIDTLKQYARKVKNNGKRGKPYILTYFEPIKDGVWIETVKGKLEKRNYDMGEGL